MLEELYVGVLSVLFKQGKSNLVPITVDHFELQKMASLGSKRKLTGVARETQEELSSNTQSRNTSVSRINKDNETQISEAIKGTFTGKLHPEIRTKPFILGALFERDKILFNPQSRKHSGFVPGTSRNKDLENREPTWYCSQNDPHPGVGPIFYQSHHSIDSASVKAPQMMTGLPEEIPIAPSGVLQENKRKRALRVSHKSAVATAVQQLKWRIFCSLSYKRRAIAIPTTSKTTVP